MNNRLDILGVRIDAVNLDEAVDVLTRAAAAGRAGYVCVTGVHGVMESRRDRTLLEIHNRSLLTVPDGMPLVVIGRRRGFRRMGRVYGPDLMLRLIERTAGSYSHYLCGATQETLRRLQRRLMALFPGLKVAGLYAPAFGPVTMAEATAVAARLKEARPDFVWIGMSTPKQERFMAALREAGAGGILLGVGAAFDLHACQSPDAPLWMRRCCLHWVYRLWREPKRLWRRYLFLVPGFVAALAADSLRRRKRAPPTAM